MELSIVICGWHFHNEGLYRELINEAGGCSDLSVKYYIASHKRREEIDQSFLAAIEQLGWKVLHFENQGWDWGAYQQFLIWQKENDSLSDYYLFLHDDIEIKKTGFIEKFLEKLQAGSHVVGNASFAYTNIKLQQAPEEVFWAKVNGFPIESEKCHIVRGSCFFTTKDVAENILSKMPIRKGRDILLANSSLRIFGGLVADRFGDQAVGYIGDTSTSSDYIVEGYRGHKGMPIKRKIISLLHPYINKTIIKNMIKRTLRFKKAPAIKRDAGLRVNLGCGGRCLVGYLNVDVNSPCADMNADILEMDFESDTVAEVLMVHVIEHIDSLEIPPFLKKIYTWLKVDGQLVLEFPDVLKVCRLILKNKNKPEKLQNSPVGLRGLYGQAVENMSIHDYHKWGWTKTNMLPILREIGFRKIYVERPDYHVAKRDTRIVAVK